MGAVVFVVGQRLQVHGNLLGTAGNSSVLMGFEPILTSLAAAVFLKEKIPMARWVGFCFCLAGLVLLNRVWSPEFHWTGLWPSLVFISSFLCESVYSILGKPLSRSTSPYKVVAISLMVGTLLNFALDGGDSIREARSLPWQGWMWLVYLSVLCTLIGYTLWLLVLVESDVNLAALTVFVFGSFGIVIPSPGGMGTYHVLATAALAIYGINQNDAFAFANIMFFTIQIFYNIVMGVSSTVLLPILNPKRKNALITEEDDDDGTN